MDLTSSHAESHNEPSNRTQKNHSHIKTTSEAQQLYYANHHNSPQNHSLKNSQLHYSLVVDKDSFQDSIARQRVLETEEDQARPSKLNNLTVSEILPSHKSNNFGVESSTRSGYLQPKKIPHHEERFFKETYYGTLDQPTAFRKKEGYFSDFADSSKTINEDYKNKKQPSLGQSRYLSRPILFTTINSKNRLSTLNPADLSQLSDIKEINNTIGGTPPQRHSPRSSQFVLDKKDRVKTNMTSYHLPTLDTGRSIEKDKTYFPPLSQLNSTEASPHRKTTKTILSKNSPTIKSMKTHESLSHSKLNDTIGRGSEIYSAYTRTLGNESPSKMSQLRSRTKSPEISEIQSPKLMQTMTKYHTKKLVDNLVSDYETKMRLKSDPFKFLEGNNELRNLRQSNIAIQKINSNVKFSRNHPGRTLSYMREPKKHIYREGGAMEQLHQFEENILGWAKSVPNFGKQRWTYDSAWEFRLI